MTIQELAAFAGVSASAVSRYLNGGSLSEQKREIIRAAIEKTGYHPEAAARTLRTKITDLVGIIVPRLDSESFSRLTAGAERVLAEEGYLCLISVTNNDPEKERGYLSQLQKRAAAGVILMATEASTELEEAIHALPIPVVVTGQCMPHTPCVYHDDFGAAKELTRMILQKGRRRIGYLGVTEQDPAVGVARKQGVLSAMQEAGLPMELPTELCTFDTEGGRRGMNALLERFPSLDAVICATDRIAFGAMEVLKSSGRRIPTDVSIVGMGDSWASGQIEPHLTTVHFYYQTCGETAAKQLVELMRQKNGEQPLRQTKLGYDIRCRDSV